MVALSCAVVPGRHLVPFFDDCQDRCVSKQSVSMVTAGPVLACCPPLAVRALGPEQAAGIAPMFKALGDPVRLRLMSMIASTAEVCVCDLTDAFEVSGPTISHHLRVLREAGLVDGQRRGTWVYYRVRSDALRQLGALLGVATPVAG
jgi:ArsR family transcriptional regulator, arsenate/arsenite/antimonite-responsive transcriptional repressor